jgi:hypothetical protein
MLDRIAFDPWTSCWHWTDTVSNKGYGVIHNWKTMNYFDEDIPEAGPTAHPVAKLAALLGIIAFITAAILLRAGVLS